MQLPDISLIMVALQYPIFLFSLSVHEAAHGLMADRLGDSTARAMGRVSLSPLAHIDPLGTVILPLLGAITGLPVIGWAKPVPVNPVNLRGIMRHSLVWVSVAGPASNVLLALICAGAVHLFAKFDPNAADGLFRFFATGSFTGVSADSIALLLCIQGVQLNLLLAYFNLLPMPPLDGWNIAHNILPDSIYETFFKYARYAAMTFLALFVADYMFKLHFISYLFLPVNIMTALLLP